MKTIYKSTLNSDGERWGRTLFGNVLILSAQEFLKLEATNRKAIRSVKFIHPKQGDNDFGRFKVVVWRSLINKVM